ncbi:hypothetical protein [Gelria sp. Kuro-4]|nr:hypothetical protein [Gelria sp. Kuro-4]MDK2926703.1 hypothetical protein [Bacillota bacterium]BCV23924.1 hypothetical protein kuro4_06970 [Gelria sp. Kuro-4]
MMMTLIYRVILGGVLLATVINMLREKDLKLQANGALVIIPLVLRLLMIK